MSWAYDAAVTVPAVWLEAATGDPADCPVCSPVLADSAADCLAHWQDEPVADVNAAIRYELGRLA